MNTQEAKAKKAVARRGKPARHYTRAALDRYRPHRHTVATRQRMSQRHKRLGHWPPVERVWTPREEALIGTMPDEAVALLTGRTLSAVWCKRQVLRIPSWRGKGRQMLPGAEGPRQERTGGRRVMSGGVIGRRPFTDGQPGR
jgi:hypothetical protein